MTEWISGTVISNTHWTDRLFSLRVHANIAPFTAGQFTKLALDIDGERVQRAYSYVNSPADATLEFYIIQAPEGRLSPALQALQAGDQLWLTRAANGFFILDEIPPARDLWMLATGTAIGPYLSMLADPSALTRFANLRLVHAVRHQEDLSYLPQFHSLEQVYGERLRCLTVVSREPHPDGLEGRIPDLIANGTLEQAAQLTISAEHSHLMLCGNPQMVRDTQAQLQKQYGLSKHLRRKPGHITAEHYW